MNTIFVITLSAHIILGLIALIAHYATLIGLLKKVVSRRFLIGSSVIAATSYVLSWISGGYYYVLYYGDSVKPAIVGGAYPWAHIIVMEWKEHIFLMLPPVAILIALLLTYSNYDESTSANRKALILITAVATILATLITLSGIIISGGAR